jgi:predicted nucleotidyltransferase
MTLSKPLEDLISKDMAMILTVLERTGQPLTGRTIASLTGTVSQPTTSRLLLELVRRGLVLKVPGGYEINRDHLAYRAVAALLGARDELQRRVAHEVDGWDLQPVSVVLFGSAAREQETLDSDIDLLVVRPKVVPFDDPGWANNVARLAERVGRWCGSPCEVLEYSTEELAKLKRLDDPLITSLLRDGITFAGDHLDTLLGEAHP